MSVLVLSEAISRQLVTLGDAIALTETAFADPHRHGRRPRPRRGNRGRTPGRASRDEVTIFDSAGLALQALAAFALDRARAAGLGVEVDL